MRQILSFLLFLVLVFAVLPVPAESAADDPDTQNLVFYEIFTGSFSDSDGDGTGDLRGIIQRLDYLNDGDPFSENSLGIQGIWLTPIFASPSYHKYDVADYYAVDPKFGTMEDLKDLIDGCHARGIRLILDLPLNHTSRTHPWFARFQQARIVNNTESPWYDFYLCHAADGRPAGHTCYPLDGTNLYYEGNFSRDMPELNFDSENVRQAMLDVARYYLDLGVDGFRFDAAKYVFYGDNPRSSAFWEWYTGELRTLDPDIWMVAEVWDADAVTEQYYSAMNCFDFTVAQTEGLIAKTAAAGDVNRYTAYVESYLNTIRSLRKDAVFVPFISNHDMDRAAGYLRDGNGRIRVAANLYLLGPGAPFIYYGEEIGLRGSRGGANTDANRRLAMRWGDSDSVQDPPGASYANQTEASVTSMSEKSYSLLNYYRRLIALRKANPEIARGDYKAVQLKGTKAGGFVSTWQGSSVLVLHNTGNAAISLDLSSDPDLAGFSALSAWIGVPESEVFLEGGVLTMDGQTSAILR